MSGNSATPSVFNTKYDEFANELLETFPEQTVALRAAIALTPTERLTRFQAEVRFHPSATASAVASAATTGTPVVNASAANPGTLLPGVVLSDAVWNTLSPANQGVITEYVKLLTMCCFLEGFGSTDEKGAFDISGNAADWMGKVMNDWKSKLGSMDFEGLFKKFSGIFGSGSDSKDASGADVSGNSNPFSGFKMPKLPEKFLKGQLAKLAEEIVKDIKPEDLGLSPEMMAECETSPSRAFELLIQLFTKNPAVIQTAIQKIGKRLQQKVQSGAIRPQEIAREAEELMKEFAGNTEFVGMMDSFKSAFGFEDMDVAKAAGREHSARLSLVKERLRKKMEAKATASASSASNVVVQASSADAAASQAAADAAATAAFSDEPIGSSKNKKGKKR